MSRQIIWGIKVVCVKIIAELQKLKGTKLEQSVPRMRPLVLIDKYCAHIFVATGELQKLKGQMLIISKIMENKTTNSAINKLAIKTDS